MGRLNRVKLIVPVVDIAHIEGAVADIIRIKDCLRVGGLDVEIQVQPNFPPSQIAPEDQRVLDNILGRSRDLLSQARGISTIPPK